MKKLIITAIALVVLSICSDISTGGYITYSVTDCEFVIPNNEWRVL